MIEPTFKIKEVEENEGYGEFSIEPLEPGYGATLGHSLRRVLLSAIPGASVTSVKISGVKHKFSTIPGIKENVVELILNIKQLNFQLSDARPSATVSLSVKGPKEVTASDLQLTDGVEIADPAQYIGYVSDSKTTLEMELTIEKGYGYALAEEQKTVALGVITTDAIFSPVTRVAYTVESTRVGRQTNLDKLNIKIWTNGTITPRAALDEASRNLASYFLQIFEPKTVLTADKPVLPPSVSNEVLNLTIDELDLPTRIYNSLRNGGIETLGQLLQTPKKDLVSMRNMGGKSIAIIEEKLQEKGISLSI